MWVLRNQMGRKTKKKRGRERVGLTLGFSVQGCIEC
jgi:hypothetical protein